jgi:hypothetical protein
MRVGYVRHLPHWPVAKQEAILAEKGVRRIYVEGRGDETFAEAVKQLRGAKDTLEVACGLRVLGDSRREWIERVAKIKEKGAAFVDHASGGRIQTEQGAELVDRALIEQRGEAAIGSSANASRLGKKANAVRWRKLRKRMPKREALVIWKGNPDLGNTEVIALMPGWTVTTAYRHFKRRDVPSGPRSGKN